MRRARGRTATVTFSAVGGAGEGGWWRGLVELMKTGLEMVRVRAGFSAGVWDFLWRRWRRIMTAVRMRVKARAERVAATGMSQEGRP